MRVRRLVPNVKRLRGGDADPARVDASGDADAKRATSAVTQGLPRAAGASPDVRPDAAGPLTGTEVAGYRIGRLLGRGASGAVYLAAHDRIDGEIALRVLGPELAHADGVGERFLRDSRLAAELSHPNVVPVHEAGEDGGVLFVAMRYVAGDELRLLLARQPLPVERSLVLAGQVAAALDASHSRGLIHGDVRPGNVLVASGDHALLTGFGLSRRLATDPAATGSGLGTVDYVAPERIERDEAGPAADAYALACVLYECLTGSPPFRRDSEFAVLWAHVQDDAPAVTSRAPHLPAGLDAVLAKGLAKDAADRYGSCWSLVRAVRDALAPYWASRRGEALRP
jgi:serine/threonine-protein kinase